MQPRNTEKDQGESEVAAGDDDRPGAGRGEVAVRASPAAAAATLVPVQVESDAVLLRLWLEGRPAATRQAYGRDAGVFLGHVGKGVGAVTLADLQDFARTLDRLAPASQARRLAALKSLFKFAHRLGYVAFDVGQPLRLPKLRDALAARIVTEAEALRLIGLEPNPRNHALLRLLYATGLRVSELCGLRWADLSAARGGAAKAGGQATVFGKGGKTRAVLVAPKLWRQLAALRRDAGPEAAVFRSKAGGALDRSQVHRIVKAAAKRAGLPPGLSAHWLRHAHASHALDHGAPLHVLQASLGHGSLTTTTRYVHARPGDGSARYLPE